MTQFTVTVERSGRWWALQCVEHPNALSQATTLEEAPSMIREAISFVTELPESDIYVQLFLLHPDPGTHRYAARLSREPRGWRAVVDGPNTFELHAADLAQLRSEVIASIASSLDLEPSGFHLALEPMAPFRVMARRWDEGWELEVDGVGVTQSDDLATARSQARDFIASYLDQTIYIADVKVELPEQATQQSAPNNPGSDCNDE